MHPGIRSNVGRAGPSPFQTWLRTGRRTAPGGIEFKFNPWHDPDDGRFTFAGTGRYFPQGGSFGGAGASGGWRDYGRLSPRTPRNHSIHVVKEGDTLTRIAASREGLRVSDLVWLNGLQDPNRLRIGQRLILPNQAYLDEGRRAKTNVLNLAFYMETHGGRLPPDSAKVPSIEEQLNSNWRRTTNNGFEFQIDVIERMRRVRGEFTLESSEGRSRRLQAEAGGKDRRQTDDGGHFVAPRFNGPREAFNHFAQDSNFNRGTYRTIEDSWAKDVRAGRRVFVDITPHYVGASARPSSLTIVWYVGGQRYEQEFPNERKAK